MAFDTVYIPVDDYVNAVQDRAGTIDRSSCDDDITDFDHATGICYQTRVRTYRGSWYVFRVLDFRKFQLMVLKHGLNYITKSPENVIPTPEGEF